VVPAEPPITVNIAVPPAQIVCEFKVIDNEGSTVTVAMSVPVQPSFMAVTV
jgi:hypothetical protein